MNRAVLTLNAGSSSIKFALFDLGETLQETPRLRGTIEGIGTAPRLAAKDARGAVLPALTLADLATASPEAQHRDSLDRLLRWLDAQLAGQRIVAVGHRVVHGGERFVRPLPVGEAELAALAALVPLAPLHQPYNLAGIRAVARLLPGVPQVASFDTAFHASQAELARRFALPRRLSAAGLKRYGFHGLSYEYIADILPRHLGPLAQGRVIVAHLGNGASMCALHQRRSVASTMGFTALDGLMMGTRCGNIDPGLLLHLMTQEGMSAETLGRMLYNESGLLGVSGLSQDMRELLASPSAEAAEAVELFCYRAVRELGSLAAALGGLDALVFTAGIGEHAAPVRERICRQAGWLGMLLDPAANARHATRISTPGSPITLLVLPTNEEWMIARHASQWIAKQ